MPSPDVPLDHMVRGEHIGVPLTLFHNSDCKTVHEQTCHEPLRISVSDTRSRRLPEHEDIPPLSELTFVLVYLANGEIWKRVSPAELWLVIPSNAKRALIRLPNALDCMTFEKEHRLLHAQMKVVEPTQWKYISLIESVPTHNCGEIFTIVAYGEVSPDFVIHLMQSLSQCPACRGPEDLRHQAHQGRRNPMA